jgi:hypothetical protein
LVKKTEGILGVKKAHITYFKSKIMKKTFESTAFDSPIFLFENIIFFVNT